MAQNTMTPSAVDIATAGTTGKRTRLVAFGVGILIVAVALVSFWAYKEIRSAEEQLEGRLSDRAKILVEDRVAAVDTQIQGLKNSATRLLEAPMFTFFAAEVNNYRGDIGVLIAPEKRSEADPEHMEDLDKLMDNVPLMVVTLRDFCQGDGFVAGRIVDAKGDTYLSTMATPPALSSAENHRIARVVETGKPTVSPVYPSPFGLVHDLVLPIFPPAFETQNKAVSVLLLTKAVTGKDNLSERVQKSTVGSEGYVVKFIQKVPDGFEKLGLGATGTLSKIGAPFGIGTEDMTFGVRPTVDGNGEEVYSAGRQVPGTDWWIVQERSYLAARVDFHEAVQRIVILAILAALVLALVVSVFWWRLVGKEQEGIAGQFRDLCWVIGDQKQLLDGINGTIKDPISMTDEAGIYRYVNRAFAEAVGRLPEEVEGLDTQAVFGFDTAKRLYVSDQKILGGTESLTIDETIWLQSKRHFFQISKAALKDEAGKLTGIVSVFRDITVQVEAQERGNRMVQQTIHALVRAIEASDPFLGGHSRIMGQIAVRVARTLGLSARDVATIEAAASLSQVGKMFVPREVLTKPGTLTPEEKRIMEQHVEYACDLLKDIEFEFPVLETVYQMHERLDGKGYPKGIAGDDISMPARVLAVSNAFAAMARPRSYRAAIPVEEVLSILKGETADYDASVVEALRKVLETPEGEKIVAHAAASKAL